MKIRFCTECGSELNEQGICPNADCVSNNIAKNNDTASATESKINHSSKDAKKTASDAANTAKQKYEAYANSFKAAVEQEKGKLIVPDCIEPDENEVSIKQYDIARLQSVIKGAFAEGRLQITNKRVLFRANGVSVNGPITMQSEYSIEEIGGVEIRKQPRFNLFTALGLMLVFYLIHNIVKPVFAGIYNTAAIRTIFIFVLTFASFAAAYLLRNKRLPLYIAQCVIMAAMPFSRYSSDSLPQMLVTLVGAVCFISFLSNAFARDLVIRILSKGGSPAMEIRHKDPILFSFKHEEYTGFSQVMPGPDVDLAIKELGATIRAIQHGQLS